MKKFTLFLVAALMVVTGATAQQKGTLQTNAKKVTKHTLTKAPERKVVKVADLKTKTDVRQSRQLPAARQQTTAHQQKGAKMQPRKRVATKAQRRAAGIIVDQPEGTYRVMRYGSSYMGYNFLFGAYAGTYSNALGEVVEGNDGCLYIHDMVTEFVYDDGYWVKAEKVEGKADTYVIHKQPVYLEYYYGYTYTYFIMKVAYDPNGDTMVAADNTDIIITWKDGVLRTAEEFNDPDSYSTAIGTIDDTDYWSGCINWNVTMSPITDKAVTALPDGAEAQDMVMKYVASSESEYEEDYDEYDEYDEPQEPAMGGKIIRMAVSGSDVYLQYFTEIDSWIKGTIEGDKVVFDNAQYLGPSFSYRQLAYFVGTDKDGNMPEKVVFDYDAANKRLSNSQLLIYANAGTSELYYLEVYNDPEIFPYEDVATTPAPVDPNTFYGSNYNTMYGYGYMGFELPAFSEDGHYLAPDQLYYKVYVGDDEDNSVFTFTPDEYAGLYDAMTEVPCTFAEGYDFWTSGTAVEFTFYFNKSRNLGVQLIYKGGGEEHASSISWYGDNNGAAGYESVFPQVENPVVNSELAEGQMALNLGEVVYPFGSGYLGTETFDVAMKIADAWSAAHLAGKKIVGVSVPFISIEGISDAKVWLSTTIATDADGKFTPDGPSKAFTLSDNGYTTVMFDEPYEIPEDGLFIGYTLTQAPTEDPAAPIALTGTTNIGGFMVHSDKVFRMGWASMEGVEGDLGLEAILTGCDADAADILYIKDIVLTKGEAARTSATVANYGYKGLKGVAYDYKVLGYDDAADESIEVNGKGELTNLDLPAVFGGCQSVKVDIPALNSIADYVYYANVTEANAQANAIEDDDAQCNVFVLNFVPKKRPLMEEYTGTWCGYCPRGYVGLEKMNELYPEDFIALSYHSGDPMEVTTDFPNDIEGYPSAYLDRVWAVDAYSGLSQEETFAIDKVWLERCEEFGVADIDVEAQWSDDLKTINIKSTTIFARNEDDAFYTIEYAVVADGLTGSGSEWTQSNYYAGGAYGYPEYMETFTQADGDVPGLVFNDVLVTYSGHWGEEGSLPENIQSMTPYTHEYSFDVESIVNIAGKPVIQDMSKVRVVAMLLNWGDVLNANKCVVAAPVSIGDLNAAADRVVKTEYFDLSGRKVLIPTSGIYVRSQHMKNGKTVNSKVVY